MAMHSVAEMAGSTLASLRKIAKEKGQPLPVDLDDKNAVAEYMKANNEKYVGEWNQQLKRQQFDRVYKQSLWSGRTPIHFNFNNWQSSLQINSKQADQLYQKAQNLAKQMIGPDTKPFNVLLKGVPGTGKTSLALAMIDYIRHHGYRWDYVKQPDGTQNKSKRYVDVFFLATDEMAELCNRKVNGDMQANNRLFQVIKLAKKTDVLVLDDFGTEGGMKGNVRPVRKDMQEYMYNITNARSGRKQTIITTNNDDNELKAMYNVKLISRLIPSDPQHVLDFNDLLDVRASMI